MTVFLNRIFKKSEEQDWSGVMMNTKSSISSTEDARDADNLPSDSKSVFRQKLPRNIHSDGYLGWNREYKNDNELVISYQFDTITNAISYFQKRRKFSTSQANTYVIEPDTYDIHWEIAVADNQNTIISAFLK
jgi:hypothetical protein